MDAIKVVETSAEPSQRLLRACAAFGLGVRYSSRARAVGREIVAGARRVDSRLGPGQLALVTGPSGGGKSSLLRAMSDRLRKRSGRVFELETPAPHLPVIDQFKLPLADSLAALARAGLADATLLGRCERELSEGEKFRLKLAMAIAGPIRAALELRCTGTSRGTARTQTLLIDEFASVLDRTTARCLCMALRRWLVRAPHVRVVVATAHTDVATWLLPEVTAVVPLGGGPVEVGGACA